MPNKPSKQLARDPRADPSPGDVLIANGNIRLIVEITDFPREASVWYRTIDRPKVFEGLNYFRKWAKKAEVIHAAE